MGYCTCKNLDYAPSNCSKCLKCNGDSPLYGTDTVGTKMAYRRAFNQVRVPSSEYLMNKSALNINQDRQKHCHYNPINNLSDRFSLSISKATVPTRGNSTCSTITSLKPGALTPGGTGVDIKHGSYARYLALKKSKHLYSSNQPTYSGIISSNSCKNKK